MERICIWILLEWWFIDSLATGGLKQPYKLHPRVVIFFNWSIKFRMHLLYRSNIAGHLLKINVFTLFSRVSTNCWVADTSQNNQSSWRPNISRRKPKIASRQPAAYACCEHKYCFPSTIRNQWIILFNKREKMHTTNAWRSFHSFDFPFATQLSVMKKANNYIRLHSVLPNSNHRLISMKNLWCEEIEWLRWKFTLQLVRSNHEKSPI